MARAEPLPFALHVLWPALHLWYFSLFLSVNVDVAYIALLPCLAKGVFD